jgi:phage protein U
MPDNKELCRLGDVVFTMSDLLTAFDETSGYDYAQHDLATGKATLQAIGEQLSQVNLAISLRAIYGDDVPVMIDKLYTLMRSGKPAKLVFASGIYQGEYVLKQISSKILRVDTTGAVASADLTLNLLEYAERQVVSYKKAEKKASGSGVKRTVKTEPTPPPSEQQYTTIGYMQYPV